MARHKQRRIGNFGAAVTHGMTRYKKYACRCAICRTAMSAYGKARYVPKERVGAPQASAGSWWIDMSREGFTACVETQQAARMRGSRFGAIANKPYSTNEVSR